MFSVYLKVLPNVCGEHAVYLKVLPDVGGEHGLEALQGVLHRQGSEKVDQPI